MDLNNRQKYLSTCFACSCISNTTSSFVFSNWSVNSRHPDTLLFNDHITPKTDSFKFTIAANFPVCGLSFQTQSGIILFYIACRLLKNILKVTLLKLAMLSWSWTPNCPARAVAGLCFLRVSFFFLATRLFRILPDIRFRPNLVIVTNTWTTTQAQTMMGSEVTMGSLGSKMWFSRKMLFLLQITWYGHVTQA